MNVCAFECPLLGTLRVLNAIATKYSHFLSVAVIDIMIKSNLGKERVYCSLHIQGTVSPSLREIRAGTQEGTEHWSKKCCLQACSLALLS